MSVTYPSDVSRPYGDRPYVEAATSTVTEETFVPRYARTGKAARSRSDGKVKTWMILAPVGVLVLGGVAAAMLLTPREDTALSSTPLAEPAATAPVLPATAAPAIAPATTAAPAPVTAAPVVRETAPVRRAAPAPAARRAAPPATATPRRVEAPAQPTSPQPYSPATSTLNSAPVAPVPTPAPAPTTAPPIVVSPLG